MCLVYLNFFTYTLRQYELMSNTNNMTTKLSSMGNHHKELDYHCIAKQ
jgi:hypothetical protein